MKEDPEYNAYSFRIENEKYVIMYDEIKNSIIKDLHNNVDRGIISYKFHKTLVNIFIEICEKIRKERNINVAALSGGCFQNLFLLRNLKNALIERDFKVFHHTKVPTNDGGISLGQAVIAARHSF